MGQSNLLKWNPSKSEVSLSECVHNLESVNLLCGLANSVVQSSAVIHWGHSNNTALLEIDTIELYHYDPDYYDSHVAHIFEGS